MEDDIASPSAVILRRLKEKEYLSFDDAVVQVKGAGFDTPNKVVYSIIRDMEGVGEVSVSGPLIKYIH